MADQGVDIEVEVAFALPQKQVIEKVSLPAGASALEAVEKSGISRKFPTVDFTGLAMGIFSRPMDGMDLPLPANYVLKAGDRVEIYRPLIMDPKQARLERARRAVQSGPEKKS